MEIRVLWVARCPQMAVVIEVYVSILPYVLSDQQPDERIGKPIVPFSAARQVEMRRFVDE